MTGQYTQAAARAITANAEQSRTRSTPTVALSPLERCGFCANGRVQRGDRMCDNCRKRANR